MADKIRVWIEQQVPDLIALVKRQVFTKDEVRSILKQRENLEYLMTRRTVEAKDFLKAIE